MGLPELAVRLRSTLESMTGWNITGAFIELV